MKIVLRILAAIAVIAVLIAGGSMLFPEQAARLAAGAERSAAHLEYKTLDLGDMHIAYLEGGEGPPLLLLHGIGADKDNWTRVSKYLTPHAHVYAIDLPGFGESSKPASWHYRVQDQVERVHEIAAALGLAKMHLGGSSMGGFIAASYAAHYPNQVSSLWLIDSAGAFSAQPSAMIRRIQAGEKIPLFASTVDEFDGVLDWCFTHQPFIPPAIKHVLAERQVANYALNQQVFKDVATDSVPLENQINNLPIPARIVWGEDDRVLDVSAARILQKLLPQSSVFLMPGVGHLPMIERPRETAEDYIAFRTAIR